MAQGSGFTSRRPLGLRLTEVPDAPTIRSGAGGAQRASAIYGGLASDVRKVGVNLLEQGRDEAAEAGTSAGIEAARAGAPFQEQTSFFGQVLGTDDAFNDAAAEGYFQGQQVQIETRRQELEVAHEADPDGFMQEWDRYAAEVSKNAPPKMRSEFGLLLDRHATKAEFALGGQKRDRAMAEASLNVRMRVDQTWRQAVNAAREAGDPLASVEHLDELTDSVNRAVQTGLLTPAAAAEILTGVRDQTYEASYMGSFEQAPSRESLQAFIEADTPEITPRQKDQLAGKMHSYLSRLESQAKADRAQLGRDAEAIFKADEAGITIDDETRADVQARSAGTELEGPLQLSAEVAERTKNSSQLSAEDLAAEFDHVRARQDEIRSKPRGLEDADVAAAELAILQKYERNLSKLIDGTVKALEDGRTVDLANARGIVEVTQLDYSSAETLAGSLDERVADAEIAEEHYGVPAGSPLTAQETDQLAALLRPGAADTETQVATLAILQDRLAPERFVAVMADVAEQEPTIAFVAGLPPDLMGTALQGRAQLAATPALAPKPDESRQAIDSTYGGVLDLSPNTRAAAVETARWLYAAESAKAGDLSGVLDPARWQTALENAVGGIVEWENDSGIVFSDTSKVVPPVPGMTGDEFTGLVDSLSDQDLTAGGQVPLTAQGQPVGANLIRRLGKLQSVGDGRYAVTMGEFGLIDQAGRPYVLDLGAAVRDRQARGVPLTPIEPEPVAGATLSDTGLAGVGAAMASSLPSLIPEAGAATLPPDFNAVPTEREPGGEPIEPSGSTVTIEPTTAPVPQSTVNLGTGEVTQPTETVILGSGARVPGQATGGSVPGQPPDVGDIMAMNRKELLALDYRMLTDAQLAQVVQRDLELRGER